MDEYTLEPIDELIEHYGAGDRILVDWARREITDTRVVVTTPVDRVTVPVSDAPVVVYASLCELGFTDVLDRLDVLRLVEGRVGT